MSCVSPLERIESSVAKRLGALTVKVPFLKVCVPTFAKISAGKSPQSFLKLSEKAFLTKIATIASGILDRRGRFVSSEPTGVNTPPFY